MTRNDVLDLLTVVALASGPLAVVLLAVVAAIGWKALRPLRDLVRGHDVLLGVVDHATREVVDAVGEVVDAVGAVERQVDAVRTDAMDREEAPL